MAVKPIRSATPGQIGAMELKNRLVLPAICTNHTYQGHFTDATVDYYGLRAKGGVRLIGGFAGWILRYCVRARVRSNQERDWRWSSKSYSSP